MAQTLYKLFYWPGIPGRGEFVRLLLEDAKIPYIDVGPKEGAQAIIKVLNGEEGGLPAFAPPILQDGDQFISQSTNICLYLAKKHGLIASSEEFKVNQIALTIADLVAEVHDAHHPIASSLYYEDQKEEAAKKSKVLRQERIPKYLKHFENVLKNNSQGQQKCLVGANITYVDLSMFHVLLGLEYAYPNAMKKINKDIPLLLALKQRVAERPNIKSYLESSRRIPFSTQGIFRHYPEVDPVE